MRKPRLLMTLSLCLMLSVGGCGAVPDFLLESLTSAVKTTVQGAVQDTVEDILGDTLGSVLDGGLLPDVIPDLGSTDGLDSETESDPEP